MPHDMPPNAYNYEDLLLSRRSFAQDMERKQRLADLWNLLTIATAFGFVLTLGVLVGWWLRAIVLT